jgi:hypothetical protein
MFNWFRELLEIRYEFRERNLKLVAESKVCESCEVLKMQLSLVQQEKEKLLNLIVDKHQPEPVQVIRETPEPIRPKHTPWAVKKQMLEQESRETARILAQKKIEELEQQILGDKDNASEAESELKSNAV